MLRGGTRTAHRSSLFPPPGRIRASLPERKAARYTIELQAILSSSLLRPGDSEEIRGKLGFAQTLMSVRSGRALLQPFPDRQYETGPADTAALPAGRRDSIPWWIAQLARTLPRIGSTRRVMPVLVYTDARGAGHIGAVIVLDGARRIHHTHAPAWFLCPKRGIFEIELVACLFVIALADPQAPGCPALL